MDANTRELEKKTRDMGYSLHNSPALLYNASSSSFFIFLIIFLWTVNDSDVLTKTLSKNVFLLRDVSEHHILTLNWNKTGCRNILYKFDLCKFVTFCHWWSRNCLFCKDECGVPRFFISYSVNIRAELCPSIHFG